MASSESASGFGIGFLVGAVVGLAIGFLFAPSSGKETRQQIKEKAAEFVERAKGKVEEVRQTRRKIAPER